MSVVVTSLIINKGAVDRGIFNGSKLTFYKTSLEPKEEFGNPDIERTADIKSAQYDKLKNGILPTGIYVNKNDVIIGKYFKQSQLNNNKKIYVDKSVIYKESESAIVHNVIIGRNEDDEEFCKVILRKNRNVDLGDKFCNLPTSQVLTDKGWKLLKNLKRTDKVATLVDNMYLNFIKPKKIYKFDFDGLLYNFSSEYGKEICTPEHKLYVKFWNKRKYKLYHAKNIYNEKFKFKHNVEYLPKIFDEYVFMNEYNINIDDFIEILSLFILYGKVIKKYIYFEFPYLKLSECYKNIIFKYLCKKCLKHVNKNKENTIDNYYHKCSCEKRNTNIFFSIGLSFYISKTFCNDFFINFDKKNRCDYNYFYSIFNSNYLRNLINRIYKNNMPLLKHDEKKKMIIIIDSLKLANLINIIAIFAGYSSKISKEKENYKIIIWKTTLNYNFNDDNSCEKNKTKLIPYKGAIMCLELPMHHIFLRRESQYDLPNWTGNSLRFGQKGVISLLMRDSDMPFTEEGEKPAMILNPHSIPSRQTLGQLIESAMSILGAVKGARYNGTTFNDKNFESITNELKQYGFNQHGYRRLYSGITGEYIDSKIFIGPVYYQRLQKFVIEQKYTINRSATDAITYQPLEGKSSNGGLRIGEMERDVLCSHGVARFISEKFFEHSDGYDWYICRCGRDATIVNLDKKIFICKYCKDNSDILIVKTSWSSKLFLRELASINIGIIKTINPFEYEIN